MIKRTASAVLFAVTLRTNSDKAVRKISLSEKEKILGNHFWQREYFVGPAGANEEIIRRYVRYQGKIEKAEAERQMQPGLEE
ncbi:hypothetical protein FJU30_17445 [Affinibrenneria salicis]|uniref:Transposase IS200-like domain-containing protein n=1 Tax=Affinibrenneria salicis TaxID=2590031 RepID=A0A5J5FX76_9GAMM|nr:hypothetical protein FJU30_17445 [Affinibrenneria salicis]